jgi:ABC-2 type transport system permease protein
VSPYEQWVALLTLMRKEVRRYTRIWSQTLLPSAITMSLYFLIFGSLIGSRIGEMGGVSYMEFVVPGLIMMAIVTNSYANVVSSFFGSKFNNSIEELLVSPTPNHIILLGFVSGGVSRGMLVAIIVTVVASLFVDLNIHSYLVVVAVVALTSILFSLCGLINAVFANTFDDINIVPTFVLTPLTYLGGVFSKQNKIVKKINNKIRNKTTKKKNNRARLKMGTRGKQRMD